MSGHTLGDIARGIGARLEGLAERAVGGVATLDEAGPSELCFADSPALIGRVRRSPAAAVVVGEDFPPLTSHNLLRVADVKAAFVCAMEMLRPHRSTTGIHHSAVVAEDARIADDAGIGPLAVIEAGSVIGARSQVRAGAYVGSGVRIGADCEIGPNAALMDGTVLGDRCIVQPGAVLGADGCGYHWTGDHHHKIPQLGTLLVQDDVEIGTNSCINRATIGQARIGRGSKLDNLVQVGHNTRLGEHALLVSQAGLPGCSRLGDGSAPEPAVREVPGGAVAAVPDGLAELMDALRRQQQVLDELRDRITLLEGGTAS